jgi:EpsG family
MGLYYKKTQYWAIAIILVLLLTFWASLRGFDDVDTEVYLYFYQNLISEGISGIQSCQSFEPIFCSLSFAVGQISQSEHIVQYFWAFVYFSVTLKAFSVLYSLINPNYKYNFAAIVFFVFISVNYVDPQIVFFLTRQYVASAFLMLGIARIATNKSPHLSFSAAILVHFGALPLAIIAFLFSRNFRPSKNQIFLIGILLLIFIFYIDSYFIEVYKESIKYKIEEYSDKNDGDVTPIQEVKLLIYWGAFIWFCRQTRIRLVLAGVIIYLFYISTGVNELIHLRYYKYLESMSWPGVLMFIYFFKREAPLVISAALSFRLYKYFTLISPESSLMYLLIFFINNFISAITSFINLVA